MPEYLDIISESLLFKGLPLDQVKEIRQISIAKKIPKGETIFHDGDDAHGFYLVVEGMVKIFKISPEGKEQILHIFGPGEPFGEVAVFTGEKVPATAEPIMDSIILYFPRSDFIDLLISRPSLTMNMLAVLSMRLRQFASQIESLSLKEVPGRLAAYLLYLAEEQGNTSKITLHISKGQLASLLGTIPETLSRIFTRLSSKNLIEVKDRTIILTDLDGLEELAE